MHASSIKHPSFAKVSIKGEGILVVVLACCVPGPPPLWIADQVRNDGVDGVVFHGVGLHMDGYGLGLLGVCSGFGECFV